MSDHTILRPAEIHAAGLHPDQMIVFAGQPRLERRARLRSARRRFHLTPQHLLGVAAFTLGFAAGQMAMRLIH